MSYDTKLLYWDHQIGPMLLDLIESSKSEIVIVSPYVKMWNNLKSKLGFAKKKGVKITLFLSKLGTATYFSLLKNRGFKKLERSFDFIRVLPPSLI